MSIDWSELIAKQKVRLSRGEGWFHFIYRIGIVSTGLKVWGLSTVSSIGLAVGAFVCWWLIGVLDEKKFKIWQKEQNYTTRVLNPYFQRMEKKISSLQRANETKKKG